MTPVWLFDLDNTLHNASPHIFPHINRSMTGYLMQHLALVLDAQAHGLALLDAEVRRREAHVVRHAQGDGARGLAGLAGNAPGLLLRRGARVAVVAVVAGGFMRKTSRSAYQ